MLGLSLWLSESSLIPEQDTEEDFLESRWYGIINQNRVDYGLNFNQTRP